MDDKDKSRRIHPFSHVIWKEYPRRMFARGWQLKVDPVDTFMSLILRIMKLYFAVRGLRRSSVIASPWAAQFFNLPSVQELERSRSKRKEIIGVSWWRKKKKKFYVSILPFDNRILIAFSFFPSFLFLSIVSNCFLVSFFFLVLSLSLFEFRYINFYYYTSFTWIILLHYIVVFKFVVQVKS